MRTHASESIDFPHESDAMRCDVCVCECVCVDDWTRILAGLVHLMKYSIIIMDTRSLAATVGRKYLINARSRRPDINIIIKHISHGETKRTQAHTHTDI